VEGQRVFAEDRQAELGELLAAAVGGFLELSQTRCARVVRSFGGALLPAPSGAVEIMQAEQLISALG
jgi:hypothetical protein